MSNRTYLIVFHGFWQGEKIIDVGDDPCFETIPTWGICRPTTRQYITKGDTIIFLAKIEKDYFFKGWFIVGDKIDYLTAMNRFPNRQNVIISPKRKQRQNKWRYGKLKNKYFEKYGQQIPHFLLDIKAIEGTFYQNPEDNHEIDNWKCRRVFHCRSSQFERCISINDCWKNGSSMINYKNYVVADSNNWDNVEKLKVTLDEIRDAINFNKRIHTQKNQHNVRRFDDYKEKFFDYIEKRKRAAANTL